MSQKKLTVITYYHLNEKLLYRCIKGLQQQTFQDFEWLLLTHRTVTENIPIPFTEIRLPEGIINKPEAYNYVLPMIQSPFIAFNDGDDTSLPLRFEKQLDYFNAHPATSICSSACIINDDQPGWPIYSNHQDIAAFMLINNPIVNPAAMLRNIPDLFGKKIVYHSAYNRAEDYDFWFQCLQHGLIFHNFHEPLISYYVHATKPENDPQENAAIDIRNRLWEFAGLPFEKKHKDTFAEFCMIRPIPEYELISLLNYLLKQSFKAPFTNANKIISNHLNTYLTNHELKGNKKLVNYIVLFKKGFLHRRVFHRMKGNF